MEKTQLMNLELLAPITYTKDITPRREDAKDAELINKGDELLLCFEINPVESNNIEPKHEQFLGNLVFIGRKTTSNSLCDLGASASLRDEFPEKLSEVSLPAGNYLFSQQRAERALDQEEWLDMAIEQQKDGLWERNKLEDRLYVRFLHEDNAFVTQIFRPVK